MLSDLIFYKLKTSNPSRFAVSLNYYFLTRCLITSKSNCGINSFGTIWSNDLITDQTVLFKAIDEIFRELHLYDNAQINQLLSMPPPILANDFQMEYQLICNSRMQCVIVLITIINNHSKQIMTIFSSFFRTSRRWSRDQNSESHRCSSFRKCTCTCSTSFASILPQAENRWGTAQKEYFLEIEVKIQAQRDCFQFCPVRKSVVCLFWWIIYAFPNTGNSRLSPLSQSHITHAIMAINIASLNHLSDLELNSLSIR